MSQLCITDIDVGDSDKDAVADTGDSCLWAIMDERHQSSCLELRYTDHVDSLDLMTVSPLPLLANLLLMTVSPLPLLANLLLMTVSRLPLLANLL